MERVVRLELGSGQLYEGFLVYRHWPRVGLVDGDSTSVLDGQEIVAIWQRGVDKTRGGLVGAAIFAIPVAVLAYAIASQGPCFYECSDFEDSWDSEGSEVGWATVGGAVAGGAVGFVVGALVSEGTPSWYRSFP